MDLLVRVSTVVSILALLSSIGFLIFMIIVFIRKKDSFNKTALIGLSISLGLFLIAGTTTFISAWIYGSQPQSIDQDDSQPESINQDDSSQFTVTSGIDQDGNAQLDDDGYINIYGTAPSEIKNVALVYHGTILDSIPVYKGKWHIKTNCKDGPYNMKFVGSSDDDLMIGDDTSKLTDAYVFKFYVPEFN